MKRLLFTVILGILVLAAWGCIMKKAQYLEEKKFLTELISSTNSFIHDLDRTNNRIAIGRSVVQYTEDIKKAKADLWKLEKLCPGYLALNGYKNAPKELQPLFKEFYETLVQVKTISEGKKAKFSQDRNLLKIFDELKEALYYY